MVQADFVVAQELGVGLVNALDPVNAELQLVVGSGPARLGRAARAERRNLALSDSRARVKRVAKLPPALTLDQARMSRSELLPNLLEDGMSSMDGRFLCRC